MTYKSYVINTSQNIEQKPFGLWTHRQTLAKQYAPSSSKGVIIIDKLQICRWNVSITVYQKDTCQIIKTKQCFYKSSEVKKLDPPPPSRVHECTRPKTPCSPPWVSPRSLSSLLWLSATLSSPRTTAVCSVTHINSMGGHTIFNNKVVPKLSDHPVSTPGWSNTGFSTSERVTPTQFTCEEHLHTWLYAMSLININTQLQKQQHIISSNQYKKNKN